MPAQQTPESSELSPEIRGILGDDASRYNAKDIDLFEKAYRYGKAAHQNQKRATGEPYFNHCVETAKLLAGLRLDPATLAAGLLHDVLEDTPVAREDLDAEFPEPIPELIEGVTKLSAIHFNSAPERQAESLRKMILAMGRDVRVILIKLCDRLHNMRTLEHLPESKQRSISRATLDVYAPLANRLGMSRIRAELEDLAMYYLHPVAYTHLRAQVARKRSVRESIVNRSIETLRDELKKYGLEPEIVGRPKHFYSIYQKMQNQNLSFDEIYDLIALRVLCADVQDCYEIVGRIHALWHPVPGRFKDYTALPKDNGYQSIHTTVIGLGGEVTEIQIRTHEMHKTAEEGIAAHWRYKEGSSTPGMDEKLSWLRRLVDWLQDVRDPTEFMDALKQDVFSDVVFCFTPKGDVREMPAGATALDFAYSIHTEVGNHCAGARINRKMVPIRTEIRMGDVVEILQSRSARPAPGWLDIVHTSRARSKVRYFLKSVDFDKNRQAGADALNRAIRARGLEIPPEELPDRLKKSLPSFKASTFEDLLSEIGFGSVSANSVAGRLVADEKAPKKEKARPKPKDAAQEIIVEGLQNMMARIGMCCNPMPGENIVGFITRGRGVSVHRSDCPNLRSTLGSGDKSVSDRLVTVRWGAGDPALRRVLFRIHCNDRPGMLHDVSKVFTDLGINIVETNSKSNMRQKSAQLGITAQIGNAAQVNEAMVQLQRIYGVQTVTRSIRTS